MSIKHEFFYRYPSNDDASVARCNFADTNTKKNIIELKEEIKLNENEKKVLAELNEAVADFFNDIDLPSEPFPLESLHLIDPKKFDRLKKRAGSHELTGAFFYKGEIFIKKSPGDDFANDLSHAMMHAISGSRTKVSVKPDPEKTNFFYSHEYGFKSGYELANDKGKVLGRGFNEAVTEIAASFIKKYSAKKLNNDDGHKYNTNYLPQIYVVEDLAEMINPNNPEEALLELIRGYTANDVQVWKFLTQYFKDHGVDNGLKFLLQMDLSADSAMDTAKKLQFDNAIKKIKNIQKFRINQN
jgi:hypothetical protein